jgi:hypothetical protein
MRLEIVKFKKCMMKEFEISDLGKISYFLGMEFTSTKEGILIHQKKYANDILKRFNMSNCNLLVTPMETEIKLRKNVDEYIAASLATCQGLWLQMWMSELSYFSVK